MSFDHLINLTPHPVVVYPADAPDCIPLNSVTPIRVIDREDEPARIVEAGYEAERPAGAGPGQVPVFHVRYCPRHIVGLPEPADGVGYIVSLPVALALPQRADLLVPFKEVRNRTGTVIGCRALSRPTSEHLLDPAAVAA